MIKTGIIEATKVNQVNTRNGKKDSFNVLLDGEWFNSFNNYSVEKGDSVEIEYTENGRYKNITNITKSDVAKYEVMSKEGEGVVITGIVRQNCLGHATKVVLNSNMENVSCEEVADKIIDIAIILENYVNS